MSEQGYNALLYWLSSQGQGSMEQFDRVCQTLKLPEKSHYIRRKLQLLGHIEVKPGAQKWGIAPAAWVQRPAGHPDHQGWFLCGQRHASWAAHPNLQRQPQAHGPDLWWSPEPIMDLSPDHEIIQAGCTAEALLKHLDDIQTWSKQLNSSAPLRSLTLYQIERWDLETHAFEPVHNIAFDKRRYDDTGIYRFTLQGGRQDEIFIRYFHPRSSHASLWLVADFTGLRFVNNYHQGMGLGMMYNPATAELWVPLKQRWPFIYERCLILSHGLLPEIVNGPAFEDLGQQWLYYRNVPVAFKQYLQDEILDARCIETKDTRHV